MFYLQYVVISNQVIDQTKVFRVLLWIDQGHITMEGHFKLSLTVPFNFHKKIRTYRISGGFSGDYFIIFWLVWIVLSTWFEQIFALRILFCLFYYFFSRYHPYTVVGDNINIMKTTFELNFDFYQALKSMDTQKYGNKEKLSIQTASL